MSEPLRKKKKTRWWKGLLIALTVIVLIIALPVGAIFACFYNGNFSNTFVDSGEKSEDVLKRVMASCLDDTKTDGKISFKITEEDFNQILIPTINEHLDDQVGEFLNGFYIDITDTTYNFVIELVENYLNVFKTKVTIVTELEHNKSTNPSEDFFIFRIIDLKIGNLSKMFDLGKSVISMFGLDLYIQDFFVQSGLNIQLDLGKNQMVYNTTDLVHDVVSMIETDNEFLDIFIPVVDLSLETGLFGFDFYQNETLELYLNLERFDFNENFCLDETSPVELDLQKHMDDLLTLIQNEIVSSEDAGKLLHYLIHGYEHTDSSNKELVDTLDLTSIGITDNKAYAGDKFPESVSLTDEATNQIKTANLVTGHLASISEEFINDMVGSSPVMGYSLLLQGKDKEGNSKLSYVTIDKFYINLQEDKLSAVCRMNMNGFHTYLIFDYVVDLSNDDNRQIVLKPAHIYLGEINAPKELYTVFFEILHNAFNEIEGASFDKDTGDITIAFEDAFDEAGNFDVIKGYGDPVISLKGNDLSDVGEISLDIVSK